MKRPYTIGITGGSGSGKTYFIKRLASHFDPSALCLLSQDHYYKPKEHQTIDKNGIENFDLPTAIDNEAFLQDIRALKNREIIRKQEYVFNNVNAKPSMLQINPADILIVEGLFIFGVPDIEKELDLKIFIEAKDHLKLSRRIKRDREERGYDVEDVLYRYEHHVMPVYESFIKPLKHHCDIIIPNNSNFERAVSIIAHALQRELEG